MENDNTNAGQEMESESLLRQSVRDELSIARPHFMVVKHIYISVIKHFKSSFSSCTVKSNLNWHKTDGWRKE